LPVAQPSVDVAAMRHHIAVRFIAGM